MRIAARCLHCRPLRSETRLLWLLCSSLVTCHHFSSFCLENFLGNGAQIALIRGALAPKWAHLWWTAYIWLPGGARYRRLEIIQQGFKSLQKLAVLLLPFF